MFFRTFCVQRFVHGWLLLRILLGRIFFYPFIYLYVALCNYVTEEEDGVEVKEDEDNEMNNNNGDDDYNDGDDDDNNNKVSFD